MLDARVLNGDLSPHYIGGVNGRKGTSFGHGLQRGTMCGVPHFRDVEFRGEFPFADLKFIDDDFPADVRMVAFNPFIPLNDRDSSIPAAFFEIEVTNTTTESLTYTVCGSLTNPLKVGGVNRYLSREGQHGIHLSTAGIDPSEPDYGSLTIATDAVDVSYQEYWYRGTWFDDLGVFWRQFGSPGRLQNRTYEPSKNNRRNDTCSLAAHIRLDPDQTKKVRFVISWSFPNFYIYWEPMGYGFDEDQRKHVQRIFKNYYATLFRDSQDSASYSLRNWEQLYEDTLTFKEALFSSSIPSVCVNAVSANISILKSPTCLRMEDGSFYGFEGCNVDWGSCDGSFTHVWNYAYALPFLFPKLERSMRDLDFRYNQGEDGAMSFRLQMQVGSGRWKHRPCADGQFGGVIKAYRD